MKKYIVVAYDIADDKRRNKVASILSAYGKRANYSVFECLLDESDIAEMKAKVCKHIRKKKDTIIYYHLCRSCIEKIERIGNSFQEESVVKTV